MGKCCQSGCSSQPPVRDQAYRRILLIALLANAAMFLLEMIAGATSGSVSLWADSLDFLGDAGNYGLSLWVLGMGVVARARASLVKAATMASFGIGVLVASLWRVLSGGVPEPLTMGWVAALALLVNLGVAVLLYTHRDGDSNRQSVWLCSRNDAIGNVAVLLAALGVFGSGQAWPDLLVASIMAALALSAAWQVLQQARRELAAATVSSAV
ncbi:cation transporter [Chitinilyticum piscinae]|uniref:Cation transporter n=1 Tax=Chitinilyticum piscinae TaxID=2866724 RepID=A0A8J7FEY3_9NEIS|nr:cation transporter [Chitinilyticum piscinae]MBE9608163.1 cation transporter [Chitinilyticum piscinae]